MAKKAKPVSVKTTKSNAKTKPDRKKREVVSAEDQIVNLIDKLIDKRTKKAQTAEDYANSALEIVDHAFFHVLFNLAYFGCDTQLVMDHVKRTLDDFSSDPEFPSFLKMLEENCEGCCNCCCECGESCKVEAETVTVSDPSLN